MVKTTEQINGEKIQSKLSLKDATTRLSKPCQNLTIFFLFFIVLYLFDTKGLCNNYQERGAEKLELSSKNLDSTPPPPPKQKKLVLTPPLLC